MTLTLPNFFIIGSGRSGTTSLYNYLKQHPDVYMSPKKEPNFYFLEGRWQKYRGNGTRGWLRSATRTREEYLAQFGGVTTETAIGEASVGYLSSEVAAAAIHQDVPDARLFAILRHPVERVYSSYLGLKLAGREPVSTFREALDLEAARKAANWSFGRYRGSGLYGQALRRYYSLFDSDQLHIFLFEEFKTDPLAVVREIFERLGVDSSVVPDASVQHNPTGTINNPLARFVWAKSLPVRAELRNYLPASMRDWAFPFFAKSGLTKPPMPEDIRQELMEFFRPDILELQELIGKDLGHWLGGLPGAKSNA